MVKAYEVYLSLDKSTWTKVASGEFKNTTALQTATFTKATAGRYLKFVAKSEINGNAWTSAAEIGIEAEADITGVTPVVAPSKECQGYYDLQGRLYSADFQSLPSGIYINNGKKVKK